jgi:hypothetical protein
VAAPPTRPAIANDLGERCQIIIGTMGYSFANRAQGEPAIQFHPQRSKAKNPTYISSSDHLTMRDSEDSRVFMNDWRKGAGQIAYLVDDVVSKTRYYDSTGAIVSDAGRISMAKAIISRAADTNATAQPLNVAGAYLYKGTLSQVGFSSSATWAAPTTAATSAAGNVIALENDGQFVYGAVTGVGINRWAIGSAAAGTAFATDTTTVKRLIWANRLLYVTDGVSMYSYTPTGIPPVARTTLFTPPTGWTITDIAAKRGGAIDSPILILAVSGNRSFIWYWDGVTIHDYLPLPSGFAGIRIKVYLGVTFIYGYRLNPDGSSSPCAYYITSDTLAILGYLGLPQSNGNPTATIAPNTAVANFGIDATDTYVYFGAPYPSGGEVWKYDMVNGGLSRMVAVGGSALSDLVVYQNGPWVTRLGDGLYGTASTYVTTATLDTSDIHLGQPWLSNLWLNIENTASKLLAGEQIAVSYSVDGGATYTSAGTAMVAGQSSVKYLLSTSTATVSNPYIRLRFTFASGTGQLTSPSLYSFALKADPQDPAGASIVVHVACPDNLSMPNEGPDWQGASGSERIFNIVNLYETQAIAQCIYMAPAATRGKNPKTINVIVDNYEIDESSGVGFGPNRGVEGTVMVELREVL